MKQQCKSCGRELPLHYYPTSWCWICLRATSEKEYSRHYYLGPKGYWEEATELAGICPFLKKNQEQIRAVKAKYQKKIRKKLTKNLLVLEHFFKNYL